jgi:outer membrane lipoprotein-sorting protein
MKRITKSAVLGLILLANIIVPCIAGDHLTIPQIIEGIDKAARWREENLAGYKAKESYTLTRKTSKGTELAGMMVVDVTYTKSRGKKYKVVSKKGSWVVTSQVFPRILKGQEEVSRNPIRGKVLITSDNYVMDVSSEPEKLNGRECLVVKVTAKKPDQHLINGKIWVDANNFHIAKLEGYFSSSPHTGIGSPSALREYSDDNRYGFPMARYWRSEYKQMFYGEGTLEIQYSDYEVTPEPRDRKETSPLMNTDNTDRK